MNLIKDLAEVFELAINAKKFIDEIFEICKKEDKDTFISSGYNAQNASSGYYAQNASSGDNAKNASSGNYAKNASSGDNAQNASSGDNAKNASSGNYAIEESSGKKSIIASIGFCSIAKAKIGSWITLAEYRKNKENILEVYYVKTEYVDGINIKEDIFYCLYDKKFTEVIIADEIRSVIISKKKNVYKVLNFGEEKESYIIENNGIYSHGKTIKEARESLLYKIGNRDTSKYKDMTLDTILNFQESIEMYRVISGACESGVKYFVEQNKIKNKKYSIKEVIELTKNQYGNKILVDFFDKK